MPTNRHTEHNGLAVCGWCVVASARANRHCNCHYHTHANDDGDEYNRANTNRDRTDCHTDQLAHGQRYSYALPAHRTDING